eukprot:3941757-Rhodomonas_salina.2
MVYPAIALHAACAMSGTDVGYAATRQAALKAIADAHNTSVSQVPTPSVPAPPIPPRYLLDTSAASIPSRYLLNTSLIPPRCLLETSFKLIPPRCLLDASSMPPRCPADTWARAT